MAQILTYEELLLENEEFKLQLARVTEERDEFKKLAAIDPMTGLYNRRSFDTALPREVALAIRHEMELSMSIFDIDMFKEVNDTHGHPVGDAIIKKMAELVRQDLREEDFVARIGGEEFAIFLPQTSLKGAEAVVRKLLTLFREKLFVTNEKGEMVSCTVSFGVGEMKCCGGNAEKFFRLVDSALYAAKKGGRNCVVSVKK